MSTRVGSAKHARKAYDMAHGEAAARGFRFLSSGYYRTAILHTRTNVVYKVERFPEAGDAGYGNKAELRNAKRMAKDPAIMAAKYVRIPKVTGWKVDNDLVIAMEFVPGTRSTPSEEAARELYMLARLADMHGENFRVVDGHIYPIDLASPRYMSPRNEWRIDRRILWQ